MTAQVLVWFFDVFFIHAFASPFVMFLESLAPSQVVCVMVYVYLSVDYVSIIRYYVYIVNAFFSFLLIKYRRRAIMMLRIKKKGGGYL